MPIIHGNGIEHIIDDSQDILTKYSVSVENDAIVKTLNLAYFI